MQKIHIFYSTHYLLNPSTQGRRRHVTDDGGDVTDTATQVLHYGFRIFFFFFTDSTIFFTPSLVEKGIITQINPEDRHII